MGKGSGGATWWAFLLLAGVLVAGAEEENWDDRREDRRLWCKNACEWQYGEDAPRRRECKSRCGHRQADADSAPAADEKDDGNGGVDTYDHSHWKSDEDQEMEEYESGRDRRCQRQCQHYHDYQKNQQCVHHCRHCWETVAGAIHAVV